MLALLLAASTLASELVLAPVPSPAPYLLSCPVSEALPRVEATFFEDTPSARAIRTVTLSGDELLVPVHATSGSGRLRPRGYPTLELRWDNLACEAVVMPETQRVCGRVTHPRGEQVYLRLNPEAEDVRVEARRTGRFCAEVVSAPVQLEASRYDGWHYAVLVTETWDPAQRGPALRLPAAAQSGIGVVAVPQDDGAFELLAVAPGMPAGKAGLSEGTRVRLSEAQTGRAGSVVRVEVLDGARAGEALELRRARFSEDPQRAAVVEVGGRPVPKGQMVAGSVVL